MQLGVPKETTPGESRVALVPDSISRTVKAGHTILFERGAGALAFVTDEACAAAGATLTDAATALRAEIVAKVPRPNQTEATMLAPGGLLISLLQPAGHEALIAAWSEREPGAGSRGAAGAQANRQCRGPTSTSGRD